MNCTACASRAPGDAPPGTIWAGDRIDVRRLGRIQEFEAGRRSTGRHLPGVHVGRRDGGPVRGEPRAGQQAAAGQQQATARMLFLAAVDAVHVSPREYECAANKYISHCAAHRRV